MRPSLRVSVVLWAVLAAAVVWVVASRALEFAHIFFAHSGIAVTQRAVADAHSGTADARPQLIPKIIHQVFHNWHDPGNDTLPDDWNRVRQTCIQANPDFEYKLWTEKTSRDFIETEYPWFLHTYDNYRYKVQRVDAVRYFILYHHGGIYLDLDNGCMGDLTPLLYYPMWICDPGRRALSNNILASRPRHPYWDYLTQQLMAWNYDYFFPYATISYASGQWFVTGVWERYHAMLPSPRESARDHRLHLLMMDDRAGADEWLYFTQERGGTWRNWDNRMFLWIGDHGLLFVAMLGSVIGGTVWGGLRLWRRYKNGRKGYAPLRNVEERYAL